MSALLAHPQTVPTPQPYITLCDLTPLGDPRDTYWPLFVTACEHSGLYLYADTLLEVYKHFKSSLKRKGIMFDWLHLYHQDICEFVPCLNLCLERASAGFTV